MKRAALIAVGSELLRLGRTDSNTPWISARLDRFGIETVARLSVLDEPEAIASTLRCALEIADLVLLTGGLGPTDDDRTREGLALGLACPLQHDEVKEREMRSRFAALEFPWTERQARQAQRPEGAVWIANGAGSADGLRLEHMQSTIVALPGVPSEMQAMFAANVKDWIGTQDRRFIASSILRVFGRGESEVEDRVSDLYEQPGIQVTVLSAPGEVEIGLFATADSQDDAIGRLAATSEAMIQRLGGDVHIDDPRSLAAIVGDRLLERGETLAVAESCTAGLLAAAVTSVPGASRWFLGGWVVYSNELKTKLGDIEPAMLELHGAVSEPIARQLAEAVRQKSGADWGVGITGIAGPDGGSDDKPVGLIHIAVASAHETEAWRTVRPGDRQGVRRGAVAFSLDRLRRALRP
jgi:nicotinamide-nucleotide amidase